MSQWVRHRNEDKHKNPSETLWVGMQDGDDTWAEPTGGSGWRWCCQRKMTVYKSATRGSHGPQDSSLRRPQSSSDLLICTSMTGSVWPQLPCCFTRSVWGIQCLIASSQIPTPIGMADPTTWNVRGKPSACPNKIRPPFIKWDIKKS